MKIRTLLPWLSLLLPVVANAQALPAPASINVGSSTPSIAADGTASIIVTLRQANGALFNSPVLVNLRSNCSLAGTAVLETSVSSVGGIATALYQPKGCVGADQITVTAGSGAAALQSVALLQVSATAALSPRASVGKALFFDKALSASGTMSCASCHSPAAAYLAADGRRIPLGGSSGDVAGFRTAPSAAYAALTPPFTFLPLTNRAGTANNGANGKLGTPRRGLMWDGRASTVFDQAKGPFLAAHEMANADSAAVLTRLLARPYLAAFSAAYGPVTARSNPDAVLTQMADAIARFESEDASFALFNSKFDAVQKGLASFSAQEGNGRALFFDGARAACAGCHNSQGNLQQNLGQQFFTDLSYRTLAVPRNWALPYNNEATVRTALARINQPGLLNGIGLGAPNQSFYDLGFCGPFRTDSLGEASLCGAFRVPGLRNVALKSAYFHNGVFGSLAEVLDFYMNRDLAPQRIYRRADGSPDIPYNDLPLIYQANREIRPPFTPLRSGAARLNAAEMQDVISFLCTLTDGFDPQNPQAYRQPQQCRNAQRP